jgi:EmrB/QacA subfamily drug resistance transporter
MAIAQPTPIPKQRGLAPKYWVLVSVVFAVFMVILDTTVVNVAFPTLRTEFKASISDAQWIISVYVLSLGVSTPLSAFLSKRFGMKRVFLAGLAIFSVGSFLCGIAPSLLFLTFMRAIQGFGGGIAVPLGPAFLFRTFPTKEQGYALGIFGIVLLVAPALGPILGGLLIDQSLWRFIFFINPPIGILGIILGWKKLPIFPNDHIPSFDWLGLIFEVVGFGAVLYAASVAAYSGWNSPNVMIGFIAGGIGLAIFALVELFVAKEPLLDLKLYGKKTFSIANIVGYISVVALFGAEFLLPIYLQFLRGRTAFETGLILLPMAVTGGVATIIAGRLYDKVGPRVLLAFGFGLLIVNTWQLSKLGANESITWIMVLLGLRGLALGTTVQTTFVTGLSVVPLKEIANGSSLTNATRQVIQAIAVAIMATVLVSTLSPQIAAMQQQFFNTPVTAGSAPVAVCGPVSIGSGETSNLPLGASALLAQACQENIAGFESAYKITFYAAIAALAMGLLLPGWPFKWAGRRGADEPPFG